MLVRKLLLGLALGSAFALTAASTYAGGGPTLVNGASTSICTAAQDSSQPGQLFANSTEEPQAAVFGSHAIAMWHQDRWSNGGGHGIGVGVSGDGGKTWSASGMPWDVCETGTPSSLTSYFRNSDPWVSFGPDGTAYASALAFNIAVPNWANAVAVATSSDFGKTWGNVQPIPGSVFTKFAQSTDKNSTTADPKTAGTAYTVWDTLFEPTDNPDDNPHTSSYTGPAFFSKTTDGGKTWSQAQVIVNTNQRQQTIGNIIVVDARTNPHTLYDFTDLLISPNTSLGQGTNGNAQVAFVKSTDGGDHWTQPQIIAPFDSLGVFDPNTGKPLRVGNGLEEVAIDPASGKLYVTWERSSNFEKNTKQSSVFWDDQIVLDTSIDGGANWSGPTVIHTAGGLPTYTSMVAVNGNKVAVTYYDNRNLPAGDTTNLPTNYWASVSTNGGPFVEQPIAGPFDEMSAPVARGFFLGDYEALQPSGSGFLAVFVMTNCPSPFDPTTNPDCGPASSNLAPTPNTNPTSTFSAAFS